MREKFDAYLKKLSRTPFDGVSALGMLIFLGVPALLVIAAIVLCFFAVRTILRIYKKKKAEESVEKEDWDDEREIG